MPRDCRTPARSESEVMPEQQTERAVVQIRPALLNKQDAAMHLGIGLTKFDELRRAGAIPTYAIDTRLVFKVADLDAYVAGLEPLPMKDAS
jgi:hypothetical protein